MSNVPVQLEPSWQARLGDYLLRPEMRSLAAFLHAGKRTEKPLYPADGKIFHAFARTPFAAVCLVIVGQNPYHGSGQAHGLSFSVRVGVRVPRSLENIFREIARDLGLARPTHGCLEAWADRGVLLLNSVLTVEQGRPGAHQGKGWEGFIDAAICALNREREGLVFLLWGVRAQRKAALLDNQRHSVLKSAQPSPRSAYH